MKSKGSWFGIAVLTIAAIIVLAGCERSTQELTEEVQASIEETYAEEGIDLEIEEFTLVKKNKSEYRGLLKTYVDDEAVTFSVNVTVDGDNFIWEIEE